MKIAVRGTFDLYLQRHEDYLSVKWTGLFLEAIKTLNRVDKAKFSPIFFSSFLLLFSLPSSLMKSLGN